MRDSERKSAIGMKAGTHSQGTEVWVARLACYASPARTFQRRLETGFPLTGFFSSAHAPPMSVISRKVRDRGTGALRSRSSNFAARHFRPAKKRHPHRDAQSLSFRPCRARGGNPDALNRRLGAPPWAFGGVGPHVRDDFLSWDVQDSFRRFVIRASCFPIEVNF